MIPITPSRWPQIGASLIRFPWRGVWTPSGGGGNLPDSDDFNRADSTTVGATANGKEWEELRGSWGIASNKLKYLGDDPGVDRAACVADIGESDLTITATLRMPTGTNEAGIVFRASDSSNFWVVHYQATEDRLLFFKVVAGSPSLVGVSGTITIDNDTDYEMIVQLSGTSIIVLHEAAEVFNTTDAFNQTATKHGVGRYNVTSIGGDEADAIAFTA